ncbi:hypothetical protein ACYSNR_04960 [Enterococcus sp. LJL128]
MSMFIPLCFLGLCSVLLYKLGRWKAVIAFLLLLFTVIGGAYYWYYSERINRKKEMIAAYFDYFEKSYGFYDGLENYVWETDISSTPMFSLDYEAYGREHSLHVDCYESRDIGTLREHIYEQYKNYIWDEYLYDKTIGNDFTKIEEYLRERNLTVVWNSSGNHQEIGKQCYIETAVTPNFRKNAHSDKRTVGEEADFYNGKSMKTFDYQEYMDYFSYEVVLIGTYVPVEGKTSRAVVETELEKIVNEAMQAENAVILLQSPEKADLE